MARHLLNSLTPVRRLRHPPTTSHVTFHHGLHHDLESLLWVIVYAMMIHQRNIFAVTDSEMFESYKQDLNECWAAHAYSNVRRCHNDMMTTACSVDGLPLVSLWLPDPREAAFFREAMRLIRDQGDGDYITYERICALFRDHINLAKKPQAFDVVSK